MSTTTYTETIEAKRERRAAGSRQASRGGEALFGVVLRKRDSPALATGMAWEERRGNRYYYRSVRDGERVLKEYVGAGEVTEALARADETIRRIRELEAAERRAEVERLAQLYAPVAQLCEMVEVLARAELVVAGYYRHKGQWRLDVSEANPMLEPSPMAVRNKLKHLQELSGKAENGDEDARLELRRAVRESTPEMIARVSDLAGSYRRVLAKSASGGDPLLEEGLEERTRLMVERVAGDKPTALEELLAERVISCWLLVELMEVLTATQLDRNNSTRVAASHMLQMMKLQESANRRYLAAIKTLAQVQKLQANTPGVQYNMQINLR